MSHKKLIEELNKRIKFLEKEEEKISELASKVVCLESATTEAKEYLIGAREALRKLHE